MVVVLVVTVRTIREARMRSLRSSVFEFDIMGVVPYLRRAERRIGGFEEEVAELRISRRPLRLGKIRRICAG